MGHLGICVTSRTKWLMWSIPSYHPVTNPTPPSAAQQPRQKNHVNAHQGQWVDLTRVTLVDYLDVLSRSLAAWIKATETLAALVYQGCFCGYQGSLWPSHCMPH